MISTADSLGRIPATINVRLQCNGVPVHYGVIIPLDGYKGTIRTGPVVPSRTSLVADGDTASPVYDRQECFKHATDLCQEAEKNQNLAQNKYKEDCDRYVFLAPAL